MRVDNWGLNVAVTQPVLHKAQLIASPQQVRGSASPLGIPALLSPPYFPSIPIRELTKSLNGTILIQDGRWLFVCPVSGRKGMGARGEEEKRGKGKKAMVENMKNGTDAKTFAENRAVVRADVCADARAVVGAESFAEKFAPMQIRL